MQHQRHHREGPGGRGVTPVPARRLAVACAIPALRSINIFGDTSNESCARDLLLPMALIFLSKLFNPFKVHTLLGNILTTSLCRTVSALLELLLHACLQESMAFYTNE